MEEPVVLNIDHPIPSPSPQTLSPTPPRTPSSPSVFAFPKSRLGIGQDVETWSSPAFLKRSRLSSNYSNLQYDPFREDDLEEEKRSKRTKFGRKSGEWRFADRTTSPEKDFYAISEPLADEQIAVAYGHDVQVIAAISPESLNAESEGPVEATQADENRDVSPDRLNGEYVTLMERTDEAVPEIPQDLSEAKIEPKSGAFYPHANELEKELSDAGADQASGDVPQATPEARSEPAPIPPSLDTDELKEEPFDAVGQAARATPEGQLETAPASSGLYAGEIKAGMTIVGDSRSLIEEETEYYEHIQRPASCTDRERLEAEFADTSDSRSFIEEETAHQDHLQRFESISDADERMRLDLPEVQRTPPAQYSPLVSEASVIVISDSSSGEEDAAPTSVVLYHTQGSSESAESSDVLSMRGSSAEDGFELETEEEFDVSDSNLPADSYDGLEFATGMDRVDSGSEDAVRLDDEIYQGPLLKRPNADSIPAVDAESQKKVSDFGLDGSAFSRVVSDARHAFLSNEPTEPLQILSDSARQIDAGNELIPPLQVREGTEADAMVDVELSKSDLRQAEISPEDKVVEESEEAIVKEHIAEFESADSLSNMDIVATSDQPQRQFFDAKPRSYGGSDTRGFENELSHQNVVQGTPPELFNDVPNPPSVDNAGYIAADLQSDDKLDLAEAEEEISRSSAGLEDQAEAMDTSSGVPPKMSTVEIIDLEREDEEDGQPGNSQSEAGLEPTLPESEPMITKPNDQVSSNEEGEEEEPEVDDEFGKLKGLADVAPSLNNLEGVDEVEYAQRAVHLPVTTEPALQNLVPMITRDTDHQAPSIEDEGNGTSRLLKTRADDAHSLEASHPPDIETTEPQRQFTQGEELLMSTVTTLQHSATANDDQTGIDSGKIMPKFEKEVLHSSDNEFPDLLDLFAASRKSITAEETATVVSQISLQKIIYAQPLPDEAKSKKRALAKEGIDMKAKEDIEEEKLESHPSKETDLQTQLLTPNATQKTQLLSQESSVSLRTLHEDESLPIPHLTQAVPALALEPTTLKRRSFVERLREMRRLSAKSPKARKSTDAASPWFAPNTLGKVIPNTDSDSVDSQDSKHQLLSDEDRPKTKPSSAPIRQSPRLHRTLPSTPPPTASQSTQTQQPGFRTTLSYFAPLSTLSSHFNTPTDVLAIVIDSTTVTRAKSGPKDFHQSLYITDPSSASFRSPITARIFRPYKTAFPEVSMGDAILLRNFKVQSQAKQLMLLSTENSAWAVFRKGDEVQMKGPPVEFAAEERGFVRGLWAWWDSLDLESRIPLMPDVRKEMRKGKAKEVERGRKKGTLSRRKMRTAAKNTSRESTALGDEETEEEYDYNTNLSAEERYKSNSDDKGRRGIREKSTPARRKTRAATRHELRDGITYLDGTAEQGDDGRNDYKGRRGAVATASPPPRNIRAATKHHLRDGTIYADGSAEDNVDNEAGSGSTTPKAGRSTTPKPILTPRTTRSTARQHLRDRTTSFGEPSEIEDLDHDKGKRSARSTVTSGPRRSTTPTGTSTPRRTRATVRHELRDGTSYTDGKAGGKYGTHELRDGTKWRDGDDD